MFKYYMSLSNGREIVKLLCYYVCYEVVCGLCMNEWLYLKRKSVKVFEGMREGCLLDEISSKSYYM